MRDGDGDGTWQYPEVRMSSDASVQAQILAGVTEIRERIGVLETEVRRDRDEQRRRIEMVENKVDKLDEGQRARLTIVEYEKDQEQATAERRARSQRFWVGLSVLLIVIVPIETALLQLWQTGRP